MGVNNDKTQNTLFDSNGENAEMLKAKAMNRDYLHAIYGEDLESLNREVRYTRTEYLSERIEAEQTYQEKVKKPRRSVLISAGVLVAAQIFTVSFYELHKVYTQAMVLERYAPDGTTKMVRAYLAAAGFFGTTAWIILLLSVLQFLLFVFLWMKQIKTAKANYQWTIKQLEAKKQEQMLAGTYDATS